MSEKAEWERVHVQNCGCHRAPMAGDPCHGAMYGSDDHHPHPFVDSGCTELRAAVRRALDKMKRDIAAWSICDCRGCVDCIERLTQHITEADQAAAEARAKGERDGNRTT